MSEIDFRFPKQDVLLQVNNNNIWCYSAAQIKNAFRDEDNIGNVSFCALFIELLRYFIPVLAFLLKYFCFYFT